MTKIVDAIKIEFMKKYGCDENVFKIEIDKNKYFMDGKYYFKISDEEIEIVKTLDENALSNLKHVMKRFKEFVREYVRKEEKLAFELEFEISNEANKAYKAILQNTEYNFKKVNRIWQEMC